MISAETVTRTWQRIAALSERQAARLAEQMAKKQPLVMVYLLAVTDGPFISDDEQERILYIGAVVWQIVKSGSRRLRKVTEAALDEAERANEALLELMAGDTDADFWHATRTMLERYPEPEVLRYVVEALHGEAGEDPDEPPMSPEAQGLAFIHLKTVLDALIQAMD
jgi:hypothetical protein